MISCATVRGRPHDSCTIFAGSRWRGGGGGGTLLAVRSAAVVAPLLGLTACAGPAPGTCRQGESPAGSVRLVPQGVSATPAVVSGGGSLALVVLLPDGHEAQAVSVHPAGPLDAEDTGPSVLQVHRSGTTTVTATDGRGGQYQRVVLVRC